MEFKLKEIGKIVTGCTPKTKMKEYYSTDDYLFIGPTDLKRCKYVNETENHISHIAYKNYSSKFIDTDSIMVDCIGSDMGNVALSTSKVLTNQQINSITEIDKSKFNIEYVYYVLSTMKKYFHQIGTNGSTMPIINKSMFEEIKIEIPQKYVQDKVAYVLNSIDKEIELSNQINDNLYEIQKEYFKKIFNNELYKEIKLEDLCNITAGGDAPKDKSNVFSDEYPIPIVSNGIDNEGIYGYTKESKINKKSITISARGTIGHKVLRNYSYYPIVRLISLTPVNPHISAEYIFYALDNIQLMGTGTTQQQLTVPMVKKIKIRMYNIDLIEQFTKYSTSLNKKIESNKLQNKTLSELRDTLLPKLMNGEIDLDKVEI